MVGQPKDRKTVNFTGSDRNEVNMEPISPWTALYDSRWNGAKAILTTPKHRYVVDTQELQLTVEKTLEADSRIDKESIHKRVQLASGVELLLLIQDEKHPSGPAMRLVAREEEVPKLTEVVAPIRDQMILLSLSPDHSYAILRVSYGHRGSKGDMIYVIDNSGHLYDTITVKERGGPSAQFNGK